ncbi:MAG: DUF262 domain-containing protein [Armatimonadetes bacterium]|nr:DUF262 domain-containing protein [Armatimonadota bacterium]
MQATPVSVTQYFDGAKQNVVPLFQRTYSWQRKHWNALWQDILDLCDRGANATHFMGAIVSLPVRAVPVGVNKHLIVDGQQRLTTLAVLLCAIRDSVVDNQIRERVRALIVNEHYDGTDRLKLLPTQGDRDVFCRLALDELTVAEAHNVRTAYQFFRDCLASRDNNGDRVDPEKVFDILQCSLQVVMISLNDSDDPYLIFESLNYKGQPLTQTDLIRNYVLMRYRHGLGEGGEHDRIYNDYWLPIEHLLNSDIEEFLRHYAMKDGRKIGRSGIYTAIKRRFEELGDEADIEPELQSMLNHAGYYRRFLNGDDEPDGELRVSLEAVRELSRGAAYPLMLRAFESHDNGMLSSEDLRRVVGTIESFMVRRAVCDVPTNTLNRTFEGLARDFSSVDTAEWLIASLLNGDWPRRWPDDEEFRRELTESPQYGRNTKLVGFVLKRIEHELDRLEPINLEHTTIEHVMPQTLTPHWTAMLGQRYQDVHRRALHTLGNLTLTGYNGELGNLPFNDKKERLSTSPLRLNSWITEQETWTADVIAERAQHLAEIALRLWSRPHV